MKDIFKWLKKYFFPHEHNQYKPHLLKQKSTVWVLLFIVVIELIFLAQVFVVFDKTSFLASVLPGVLTTLTNEERAQNNASPLVENSLLVKAAELKAQDMASRGYFAHTSPDGKTPWYWLDQVGYKYNMAGENLAVNFFESQDVAEAWMESPTHRANIVKQNYKEIGIGVANGTYEGRNTVFVAQFFGTPQVASNPPVIPATQVKNTLPATTKPKPKTNQPTALPKPTTPATSPVKSPVVATAPSVNPTSIQVLGEETNPVIIADENTTIFSYIKSFIDKVLTSPSDYVNYVYGGIALIFTLVLLLAIFIKKEIQHPATIARGFAIVVILVLLSFVNIKIFHLDVKLPDENLEASVIAY